MWTVTKLIRQDLESQMEMDWKERLTQGDQAMIEKNMKEQRLSRGCRERFVSDGLQW